MGSNMEITSRVARNSQESDIGEAVLTSLMCPKIVYDSTDNSTNYKKVQHGLVHQSLNAVNDPRSFSLQLEAFHEAEKARRAARRQPEKATEEFVPSCVIGPPSQ